MEIHTNSEDTKMFNIISEVPKIYQKDNPSKMDKYTNPKLINKEKDPRDETSKDNKKQGKKKNLRY